MVGCVQSRRDYKLELWRLSDSLIYRVHERSCHCGTARRPDLRLVPQRRQQQADGVARLAYSVVGRYVAGSLVLAAIAGTAVLIVGLLLHVPLSPLLGAWVAGASPRDALMAGVGAGARAVSRIGAQPR